MCLRKAIWKMETTMMAQQLKADNDGRSCECSHRLACHCTRHVSFSEKKRQSFFSCFTSVSKEEFSVVILKKGDKIHNKKNETNEKKKKKSRVYV
ncbi:hypothetical protein OUZ56_001658 [Daphnia magna]|uniref:Uncharacterized protein n=1 Tax=Daphnia magna TaxID=35525 RepID=A0ABR0A3V8_9CRUS|nr:hypothetical protein OUZ56_001658 [Daphnia magna]